MQRSHTQFFTSLRHLEKRLKLENHPPPIPPPPEHQKLTTNDTHQTESLGTPIYLNNCNESTANTNPSTLQESEAPIEFLSNPQTHHSPPQENQPQVPEPIRQAERLDLDDDIELLMRLLRLSGTDEINENGVGCDDGFYGKIVGVKGPKSGKEVERLEGWIKHYLGSSGEKKEPLRLAYLLLGKAAFVHSGDDGFGGFEFPSTIHEFLQNDPPIE